MEKISQYNHDALGADGWEISAHYASAPDHAPIQGRQYTDEAFSRLNGSLRRRIGTLNCGHNAFPIILGVSTPQHSRSELERMRRENEKGVDYEGRHFATVYDATQYQRRIERAIRTQKRRILVDDAAGDENDLLTAQIKYARLNQEYKRFSNATGLPTQRERLEVSGFGRTRAQKATKTLEKYKKLRYPQDGTIVVTDDWTKREHPHTPKQYIQNAVVDTVSQNGRQRDRMYFDATGRQRKQISNGPHGNIKKHSFGKHGEHAHDIVWQDGKIVSRFARELTDEERRENGDIL